MKVERNSRRAEEEMGESAEESVRGVRAHQCGDDRPATAEVHSPNDVAQGGVAEEEKEEGRWIGRARAEAEGRAKRKKTKKSGSTEEVEGRRGADAEEEEGRKRKKKGIMKWYLVVAKEETGTPLGITIPALNGLGASASEIGSTSTYQSADENRTVGNASGHQRPYFDCWTSFDATVRLGPRTT